MKIQTAVVSVSDKNGIEALAAGLVQRGIHIISSGGTAALLEGAGISVTRVSQYTGFPEILEGRVKTLHPRIHGGILARPDFARDAETLEDHSMATIGLVVVNLYPFVETIRRSDISQDDAIEQIDIGGPTLVRAAAKNHRYVTVVVDPADYSILLERLDENNGETPADWRRSLARKAFHHTASYDSAIAAYFDGLEAEQGHPTRISLHLKRAAALRYGENPHQSGSLFVADAEAVGGLAGARQLQGKELSFNNYLDLNAAWSLCSEFRDCACIIVKHNNPCGAAIGAAPTDAYDKALACDPVSAFGSIIAFNRPVDGAAAERVKDLFVEAVVAPSYADEARKVFSAKKNLRLMELPPSLEVGRGWDIKCILGGYLVQDPDRVMTPPGEWKTPTKRRPDDSEIADLLFAWKVAKHVKSNAIVCVKGQRTLGIGAGQMSRVDSVRLASEKAQSPLKGCAMASDAFFPFRDGIDAAAEQGVRAVIQPGGSRNDPEVIAAADEHGMAMVFTGVRHFRH